MYIIQRSADVLVHTRTRACVRDRGRVRVGGVTPPPGSKSEIRQVSRDHWRTQLHQQHDLHLGDLPDAGRFYLSYVVRAPARCNAWVRVS